MTDNEIIKALGCCSVGKDKCKECPLHCKVPACSRVLAKSALDLINRQKAEIERHEQWVGGILEKVTLIEKSLPLKFANVRVEAIKEFAERLKYKTYNLDFHSIAIDNLVKEMVGEEE